MATKSKKKHKFTNSIFEKTITLLSLLVATGALFIQPYLLERQLDESRDLVSKQLKHSRSLIRDQANSDYRRYVLSEVVEFASEYLEYAARGENISHEFAIKYAEKRALLSTLHIPESEESYVRFVRSMNRHLENTRQYKEESFSKELDCSRQYVSVAPGTVATTPSLLRQFSRILAHQLSLSTNPTQEADLKQFENEAKLGLTSVVNGRDVETEIMDLFVIDPNAEGCDPDND